MDCRGGYISKILYVKTKESGPLGGVHRTRPLDPPALRTYVCMYLCVARLFVRWALRPLLERKIDFET